MTADTDIERARTRVEAERDALTAKREAFGSFIDRISGLAPDHNPTSSARTTVGTQHVTSATDGQCRKVRTAFAETVGPHSVDEESDKSLLETIRAEFTEPVAVALAPTTEASFTLDLRRMLITEAETRRTEIETLDRALGREATHLQEASEATEEITAWIVDANETPLSALGFDALRQRHETLAGHRSRCETLARRRQDFLDTTTSNGVEAGIRHRQVLSYLYEDFPVDHPVLATVTKLATTCRECQRALRDHLVRRA